MHRLCIVPECENSKRANKGIRFYSVPLTDERRRLQWLQLVRRTDLNDRLTESYLVCAAHFTDLTSSELVNQDLYPNLNLPMSKPVPTSSTNCEETDILNDDDELKEYSIKVTLDSESDEDINHQPDAYNSILFKEKDQSVKKSKMLIPVCNNAHDFFSLFINETFLTLVAQETNKFAQAEEEKYDKEEWFDTNTQELKVFLGLLLHMGTFRTEHIQDYWETDRLFTAGFTDFMPYIRFRQIFNYLCFAFDKNDGDNLWKIRPIIDNFNTVMKKTYNPKKVLIVDESAWQERDDNFFLLDVAEKEERADSSNLLYLLREIDGMVLSLYVHEPSADNKANHDIILELVKEYLDSGRTLYLHSHQASYELAVRLLARKTYCSGTLLETASNIPDQVATAHLNVMDHTACCNEGVTIGKWRYCRNNQVFYLTTENMVTKMLDLNSIQRKSDRYSQAPAVLYSMWLSDYTKLHYYGACYPLQNMKLPEHTKFFIHFLTISLLNAHELYSDFLTHRKDFSNFRMQVIQQLLPESVPEASTPRLLVPHHLGRLLEPKKCLVCVKQYNLKMTRYYCQECPLEPPLCVECFCDIHC